MLVCYKEGSNKITKDFSSVEMLLERKGGLFSSAIYSIVGVVDAERVVLYKGLTEKKAKHQLGLINFACANSLWGGGIYYV